MKEKLVGDIRLACEELAIFLDGKERSDLDRYRGLQLIIEREFEIIGEAMNRNLNPRSPITLSLTPGAPPSAIFIIHHA